MATGWGGIFCDDPQPSQHGKPRGSREMETPRASASLASRFLMGLVLEQQMWVGASGDCPSWVKAGSTMLHLQVGLASNNLEK